MGADTTALVDAPTPRRQSHIVIHAGRQRTRSRRRARRFMGTARWIASRAFRHLAQHCGAYSRIAPRARTRRVLVRALSSSASQRSRASAGSHAVVGTSRATSALRSVGSTRSDSRDRCGSTNRHSPASPPSNGRSQPREVSRHPVGTLESIAAGSSVTGPCAFSARRRAVQCRIGEWASATQTGACRRRDDPFRPRTQYARIAAAHWRCHLPWHRMGTMFASLNRSHRSAPKHFMTKKRGRRRGASRSLTTWLGDLSVRQRWGGPQYIGMWRMLQRGPGRPSWAGRTASVAVAATRFSCDLDWHARRQRRLIRRRVRSRRSKPGTCVARLGVHAVSRVCRRRASAR